MPYFGFREWWGRLKQRHRSAILMTGPQKSGQDETADPSTVPRRISFNPSEDPHEEVVRHAPKRIRASLERHSAAEKAAAESPSPRLPVRNLDFDSPSLVPDTHKDGNVDEHAPQSISPAPSPSVAADQPFHGTHTQPLGRKVLRRMAPDNANLSDSSTTASTSHSSDERTEELGRFAAGRTDLTTEPFVGSDRTSPPMYSGQIAGTSSISAEAPPQILVRAPTASSIVGKTNSSTHSRVAPQQVKALLGIPAEHSPYATQQSQKRKVPPSISSGTKTDVAFPFQIQVKVHLLFNGDNEVFKPRELCGFEWTAQASYDQLSPAQIINHHVQACPELDGHEIYIRHGSCQVKGPSDLNSEGEFSKVDDIEDLSQYAIRDICGFISKNLFSLPSLEVHWDFSSARLRPLPSENYAEAIRLGLEKKVCTNFKEQQYIPACDLEVFLDVSVARNLLDQDASVNMSHFETARFLRKVQTFPARKLLVLCVFSRFNLDELKHLIDHGFNDETRPQPSTTCGDKECTAKYAQLRNNIHTFFPRNIKKGQKRHMLTTQEVVPLQHPPCEERELGQGAYGVVTQVIIDRSHYSFPGDPDCRFALKTFASNDLATAAFLSEVSMLDVLTPHGHDHIAGHITAWSQADQHFILYPKAAHNLRSYMTDVEPPALRQPVMMWFFKQLGGLADAIDHVHRIKDGSEDGAVIEGCHHDIKPENILVFERVPNKDPTFKIADFGAGHFYAGPNDDKRSKQYSKTGGTETYFAPDWERHGNVSKSFDMWALGCVFLELHLWLFRFHWDDGAGFSTKRAEFSGADPRNSEDRFWVKTKAGYVLKPAVERVLEELEAKCNKMRAFIRLIKNIRKLLQPNRDERRKAEKLVQSMRSITDQLSSDLEANPDFYLEAYKENIGGPQTDLELPFERLNPLVSSVGSSGYPSSPSHSRRGTQENESRPSDVAAAPTPASSEVIETGMAAVDSVDMGIDDNSSDTELGPPDEATHNPMASSMSPTQLQSLESLSPTLKVPQTSG